MLALAALQWERCGAIAGAGGCSDPRQPDLPIELEPFDREPVPWSRGGSVDLAVEGPAVLGLHRSRETVVAVRAQRHDDAVDANVVAHDAVSQVTKVELQWLGYAGACDLLVEVDLRGRTEPVLEEPLEAQQLLVSSSTAEVDLEEREVSVERHELNAWRSTGGQQQWEQNGMKAHDRGCRSVQKRWPIVKSACQSTPSCVSFTRWATGTST